ncbi:hypothetical protein Vadar_033680 [Vaccinium darrowii]|uniref:Uncharacterized protein n=1 Tax=Vaccinium darrowii TaxID=229202 RepID=A0ACB7X626_9ERIC|nr:hypothetical protein Vadar_033680 [Vaccinium darrowii]
MTNNLDGMRYVKTVEFSNDLRDFIFEELKLKSVMEIQVYETRGDWVLRQENSTDLLRWINMVDFDESLLLWHIATELCFNTDESNNKKFYHLSKFLSNYMLHLLIVQSSMISTLVGSVPSWFRDTCAEAKRFFRGRKIRKAYEGNNCCPHNPIFGNCFFCIELEEGHQQSQTSCCCFKKCCHEEEKGPDRLQIRACKSIIGVNTEVEPVTVRGDCSRSVLFDACVLAKELKKLETERMWQIISRVWVEMLSYAACHCRANIHAAHLSEGGHLITLVWLLICHLG